MGALLKGAVGAENPVAETRIPLVRVGHGQTFTAGPLPNARNPAQAAKARTVRKNTFTSTLLLLVILPSPDQGAKPILHYPSTIIEQQPIRLQCCRNRCLHQGLTPHQSGTTLQVQGRRLSLLP